MTTIIPVDINTAIRAADDRLMTALWLAGDASASAETITAALRDADEARVERSRLEAERARGERYAVPF